MTRLSRRRASAYFLEVWSLGALRLRRVDEVPLDAQLRARRLARPGARLDHLGQAGAVLVGLDLVGHDLGEHQVVVRLPALSGSRSRSFCICSSRFWMASRTLSRSVAWAPAALAAGIICSGSTGKRCGKGKGLVVDDDLVQGPAELRPVPLLEVVHAALVVGQVLLQRRDRVRLLLGVEPQVLLAGEQEVDAAGVLGQAGQLVGGEPRGLLVPAFVQAVPLEQLDVGRLGAAADRSASTRPWSPGRCSGRWARS